MSKPYKFTRPTRASHKPVVPFGKSTLESTAKRLGIAHDLIASGYYSSIELTRLYVEEHARQCNFKGVIHGG